MKHILIGIIVTAGIFIFSFGAKKPDTFKQDFLSYRDAVIEYSDAIKSGENEEATLHQLIQKREELQKWEDRIEEEYANKWDTFESSDWPSPPTNWRCHLDCVYKQWHCSIIDGDELGCITVYQNCVRSCKE